MCMTTTSSTEKVNNMPMWMPCLGIPTLRSTTNLFSMSSRPSPPQMGVATTPPQVSLKSATHCQLTWKPSRISKIRMNVSVLSLHGYRTGLRSPQTFLPHNKETLARVSQIKHSTWHPLQESQAKLSHTCSLSSCSACNSHFHSLDRVAWESVQWSFECRTHTAES